MENRNDNQTNGHFYLLLVAIVMVVIVLLGNMHRQDNMKLYSYNDEDLEPIGGITQYMSHLQYHCLEDAEPDMEAVEAYFDTVAVPDSDIPETEEEVEEDGTTGEDTRDTLLQSYFGYVPSDDEITLWQRVIMAECGYTEPDSGIMAVADCIANRCQSERFPDKITDVVYQPGQFQTVSNGAIWRYEVTDRVAEICSDCISEGRQYDFLFFTAGGYNPYCKPGAIIGNHYFGY